jgi:Uma2 family endonuclease
MNIALNQRLIVREEIRVDIPGWVTDLASFRRWFRSDEPPEKGRVCFLAGRFYIDMSREQFFSHNQIKVESNRVLADLAKREKLGRYVADGMQIVNEEADLSCQPDGAFVSHESFRSGKVRLVEGIREGFLELEGSPDMALEVVSPSSREKDYARMPTLYWKAGIREYWIVDALGETVQFKILRWTSKKYVSVRPQKGWLKSTVFGRSFRLVRGKDADGNPEFTLEVR